MKTKNTGLMYILPSKTLNLINDIYQIIRLRYEDTLTLDNILSNGKTNFGKEQVKELMQCRQLIKEIERKELVRKESEKLILPSFVRIQVKKTDKILPHLRKIIIKILPLISLSPFSLRYPKVPTAVHVWSSFNTGYVGKFQEDQINGGCHAIEFIKNTLKNGQEGVNLYYIIYYSLMESRRYLDEYLVFFTHKLTETANVEEILEVLRKNNSHTEKNIRNYHKRYIARHGNKAELEEKKADDSALSKGERIIKMLEEELKGRDNISVENTFKLKELINKFESTTEPSNKLLEEYLNDKHKIQNYLNQLEDEYKEVEEVKHVRKRLVLKSIIKIQRAFRKCHEYRKHRAAKRIQKAFRHYCIYIRKRRILDKVRKFTAIYKIIRWFKLIRKKLLIKSRYNIESDIINKRMENIYNNSVILNKIIKVQSFIRKLFVIHNTLPYLKTTKQLRIRRAHRNECKKVMKLYKELAFTDKDIIQLKLAARDEIRYKKAYLNQERMTFKTLWNEYEKLLEIESVEQTSKHMKNWVVQHDKDGKSYWFNMKTKVQQYNHPGKAHLQKIKEKIYAKEFDKHKRNIAPILIKIDKYKERCQELEQSLLKERIKIISRNINNSNI